MVIYFSGTGNSKFVAEKIAKKINEQLLSLNNYWKEKRAFPSFDNEKRIIVVSPTYAWKIPLVVEKFFKETHFSQQSKIYFVMTCGGEIGNAHKYNRKMCENKQLIYMGTDHVVLPDNYIIMFQPIKDDDAKKLINDSLEKIQRISEDIIHEKFFPKQRNNLYDKFMSSFVNRQFYKYMIKNEGFHVNENCIGCGKCEKVCSQNIIHLENNKPVWNKKGCIHCMACLSYCPKRAIDYKKKTINKKPYKIEDYQN